MRRRPAVPLLSAAALWAACAVGCSSPSQVLPTPLPVTLNPDDRILILAPHPDDEVLGCGGILQQAAALHLPVHVAFLTYGDNNQWSFLVYRKHPVLMPGAVRAMGLVRHDEALAADRLLGLAPEQLTFLGYPDFGILHIWTSHWSDRAAFRSMLTKVTAVPYANALRPGAPYKGEEVLQDLTTVLRRIRPTKVFVSHPADYMPDHAALYLFTRVALWDLEAEMRPELYPYLVHFRRWPRPARFHPTRPLQPPRTLRAQIQWHAYQLTPSEVARKREAIQAHRTQYGVSAAVLLSFIRPNELFGDFPPLRLPTGRTAAPFVPGQPGSDAPPDDQLTSEERTRFVGLEGRRMWLEDGRLVLSVTTSRPLAEAVGLSVFVFGYRADRPFGQMPKLHLQLGALNHNVLDQDQVLTDARIEVARRPTEVIVRIPLETLGHPQRILTSARTYLGDVPLDWVSWRVLEVPGDSP